MCVLCPGCIHIPAKYSDESFRHTCSTPSCCWIIRCYKSFLISNLFKCIHMFHSLWVLSRSTTTMPVLIFNLYSDNTAAILVHKACCLLTYLSVKLVHKRKIFVIIFTKPKFSSSFHIDKPVRKTSVSALSMRPRPDAQPHLHSGSLTAGKKITKASVTFKIPLTLRFLMMNPEHICRNNLYSATLHIVKCTLQFFFGIPRKMKFTHNRKNRSTITHQIILVIWIHNTSSFQLY